MKFAPVLFVAAFAVATASAQQATVGGQPVQVRNLDQLTAVPANTPLMPPNAARARAAIPVKQIKVDSNGVAHLSGAIRRLGEDVYRFQGNAGDVVRVISKKATAMEFAIFSPQSGTNFGTNVVLPADGVYEVRIVNNRRKSAWDKTPRPYNLTFTLARGQ